MAMMGRLGKWNDKMVLSGHGVENLESNEDTKPTI